MKVFLDFVRFRWKELFFCLGTSVPRWKEPSCVEILRASRRAARSDAAGQLRRRYMAERNHLVGFEA